MNEIFYGNAKVTFQDDKKETEILMKTQIQKLILNYRKPDKV
jgi:hypothetical protein